MDIPLATFATNLVAAAPTEQTRPVSARTRCLSRAATWTGEPITRPAPDTSRNASSIPSRSTEGVSSSQIAKTCFEKW